MLNSYCFQQVSHNHCALKSV